jgi:hypothetical protein
MSQKYVIYSPNEAAINDGKGFWSEADTWVDCITEALHLDSPELCKLPLSTGGDAKICPLSDFPSDASG